MPEKQLELAIKNYLAENPEESRHGDLEIDSPSVLELYNADTVSSNGRKCTKIAVNVHTNEVRCVRWE